MSFVSDFFKDISGRTARDAATRSGDLQAGVGREAAAGIGAAGERAFDLFNPFAQLGQQGIDAAGFLTDPQAQFDFLQNNPLFQLALQNANEETKFGASASGRLSAGDTLSQLSNNVLLSASPLIDRQRQDIFGLLGIGQGTALNQADILQNTAINQGNFLTGAAAAEAGGIVGGANAQAEGSRNLLNIAGTLAGSVGVPRGTPLGGF